MSKPPFQQVGTISHYVLVDFLVGYSDKIKQASSVPMKTGFQQFSARLFSYGASLNEWSSDWLSNFPTQQVKVQLIQWLLALWMLAISKQNKNMGHFMEDFNSAIAITSFKSFPCSVHISLDKLEKYNFRLFVCEFKEWPPLLRKVWWHFHTNSQ